MIFLRIALLLAVSSSVSGGQEHTLEPRRLHLGKPGQFEWDIFKDRPVDAERLEIRFQAKANTVEHTLRIWQRDVKLGWPVLLNNRRIGSLTTAETAQECVLPLPAGFLRDGENVLTIGAVTGLDDIEVGPIILVDKPVAEAISGASLHVTITHAVDESSVPCRLTLTRPDGTLQPLRAEPAAAVAVRTGVVYTRDGRTSLTVPPGDYVLHASRGFEWSTQRLTFSAKAGKKHALKMSLRRQVDTTGWIAADSHIHTLTHSGHGDAKIEERMLTIAGEGIELAIATDHNHHTDYAPAAGSMGVANLFTSVMGNEVTTKHGHFNAFPVSQNAPVVNHNEEDWSKLMPAIRATPGVKVITLNHPRDLHSGFIPLGGVQFNAQTGRHRQADALKDVNAMEVITSAAMQSDIFLLYRDWFALLNRGHRIAAVASSDSHDVNRFILGQGRTYVAAQDADPARLDLEEVWHSYQQGRLLVSFGLLVNIQVDGRFNVGDLATGLSEEMEVQAVVSGPAWVRADRVTLYANGIAIREEALSDKGREGEKARITWKIPKPAHDVHLVAIATGPGIEEPFWEIPRPYQPSSKTFTPRVVGSTNPVWVDANGDGRFQSALAIAQDLIQKSGGDRDALTEPLKKHDEAVVIQAESLLSNPPPPQ
ncbi:MAG: CehA/McbA family metallohydrolase [Prosthecobacter sp.]